MSGARSRARKVCSNHCKKKHYREAVDLRSPTRELEHEGMGKLGKPHYLWVRGGRQDADIAITLANRLIFASFFQNILFGP